MGRDEDSPRGGVSAKVYEALLTEELPTLLDDATIFMHDNAPIHKAERVAQYFEDNSIQVLDWPPYSPDLNPIEHCWFPLKKAVHAAEFDTLRGEGGVRETLARILPHAWESLEDDFLTSLIESMPRRIEAVIEADGWYTGY